MTSFSVFLADLYRKTYLNLQYKKSEKEPKLKSAIENTDGSLS